MTFDGIRNDAELAWVEHTRPQKQWRIILRTRLAEAQNWRCCYCAVRLEGMHPDDDTPTLEHVIPKARGGAEFREDNLVVACLECNRIRGSAMWSVHWETLEALGRVH